MSHLFLDFDELDLVENHCKHNYESSPDECDICYYIVTNYRIIDIPDDNGVQMLRRFAIGNNTLYSIRDLKNHIALLKLGKPEKVMLT